MIRKIDADQLKPGMFIHALDCGWLKHPFFRNKFKIKEMETIEKIIKSGIKKVYIDTEKGLDISLSEDYNEEKTNGHSIKTVDEKYNKNLKDEELGKGSQNNNFVPLKEELERAKEVKDEARKVVQDIMYDVRLGKQIEMEKVDHMVNKMVDSIFRNNHALTTISRLKEKDEYTFMHSVSVSALMISFCRHLGLDRNLVKEIGTGALLHDIGKVKIPDEILKKPGKVTGKEYKKLKEHVVYSGEILSETKGITNNALQVATEHHERFDGSGYNRGLKGTDISRFGQMAAIVDTYDALTSNRCYQKGIEPTEALRRIFCWANTRYREELTHEFIRCVGIYPVCTLVRLERGLLGVVIDQRDDNLLYPVVRVVYDIRKGRSVVPYDIDLSMTLKKGEGDRILCHEIPDRWGIDPSIYLNAA